jgi:transcriptional regulator with XRE-family HTH domain
MLLLMQGTGYPEMIKEDVQEAARRRLFQERMGRELRTLREAGGVSQAAVADLFGWQRNAISKLEAGRTTTNIYNYLRLINFLAHDTEPDHPARALLRRFMPSEKAVFRALLE